MILLQNEVRKQILYMDGFFLEREGPLTHLIAGKCRGTKYRDAVALGKPILNPEWIQHLWNNREKVTFNSMKEGVSCTLIYRLIYSLHNI